MKKLLITAIVTLSIISCRTGRESWTAKHLTKVHENRIWMAGNDTIRPVIKDTLVFK